MQAMNSNVLCAMQSVTKSETWSYVVLNTIEWRIIGCFRIRWVDSIALTTLCAVRSLSDVGLIV